MGVWDPVKACLQRLAGTGWHGVLLNHGLDIQAADLQKELQRTLAIDRKQPGFADFATKGRRALEPGDPALSLLYHAFASPLVHPAPNAADADYPTLQEIDALENLIYSLARSTVTVSGLVPAVFAYEYRTADSTPHRRHADLVFSRTGIARNGSEAAQYDAALRSFRCTPGAPNTCPVSPARYGVFLARRDSGRYAGRDDIDGAFFIDCGAVQGDTTREFLVPVHKLFAGAECVDSETVSLEIVHRHVNEKLHRAATTKNGITVSANFDLKVPPFMIVSQSGDGVPDGTLGHIHLDACGDSAVVRPQHGALIWTAMQKPPGESTEVLVTFTVPRATLIDRVLGINRINRRYTSYHITENVLLLGAEGAESVPILGSIVDEFLRANGIKGGFPRPRNAPEFVNIRHTLDENGQIVDMRTNPQPRQAFLDDVENGNYQAVLFVDGCADGCVSAELFFNRTAVAVRPAFSVVAPPDFFPGISQIELVQWLKSQTPPLKPGDQFKQGGPDPLSLGRLPPNQGTIDPVSGHLAFADRDQTMVAMVARAPRGAAVKGAPAGPDERASFLTDASSNVFAPGWDVTYAATDNADPFYATYGLGSPFPEDAKLCAAANAYWPAVSPDASRTFGRSDAPTAMPLMDDELGYHPGHRWVTGGTIASSLGWDGECGPFLTGDGMSVNYADIERSDYVANMRSGTFSFSKLARIDATEMGLRMDALRKAVDKADNHNTPASTKLWLISAEPVNDWVAAGSTTLKGAGYRFLFATTASDNETEVAGDTARLTKPVAQVLRCRVDSRKTVQIDKAAPGAAALALYTL